MRLLKFLKIPHRHVFDPVDMINIDESLEPFSEVAFNEKKKYKENLINYRVICPCWKCGKVLHADCGLNLDGEIKHKGKWMYVEDES